MDFLGLGCSLLAFLLYYNTLDAGFVYDDRRAILTNPDVLATNSWWDLFDNDFWGTPLSDSGSHGSYRPLCVMTFRLNYLLGGLQPWGYHLVNVLLHSLATALVVRVARKLFKLSGDNLGPAVTGLLFATHPIHTEAVASVVGRADVSACVFFLMSFLAYTSHMKFRDQHCCLPITAGTSCACCNSHPYRSDRKRRNDSRRDGGNKIGGKYHNFVINLPRQVTNCTWPNRYGNDGLGTHHHENLIFSLLSSLATSPAGASKAACLPQSARECECSCEGAGGGGECVARRVKQWLCLGACLVLAFAAVLNKETGITVLIICGLYDMLHASPAGIYKKQLKSLVIISATLFAILALRLQITWGNTPQFATADNPTARAPSITTRFLTFMYLPSFNFRMLLCPLTLSFDWSMDSIPRITSLSDARNFISISFYFFLYQMLQVSVKKVYYKQILGRKPKKFARQMRRKPTDMFGNGMVAPYVNMNHCPCPVCHHALEHHSIVCRANNNNNSISSHSVCICQPTAASCKSFDRPKSRSFHNAKLVALAFLTLPFLPATNLFFYVGFVVAERVLYLPSVGFCLLVAMGVVRIKKARWHVRAAGATLMLLMLLFSLKTITRNRDWQNEEALYRSAVTVSPPKAYGNLGSILSAQGRAEEAEWAYRKALEHRANMADVHYNLGNLLRGQEKYREAIESYEKAIHFRPSLALAYVNLGVALIAAGRCQEAVSILRQGSRLDGSGLKDRRTHETARVSALLQLGGLYSDQGRFQMAVTTYKEALHIMPSFYPPQSIYNLLGETLTRLQRYAEAEKWYQAALKAQPDHVPAHITYGKLLAKNDFLQGSRIGEAEQWFRRAQRLAPTDPSVYHHYGEFLASQARHAEAAVHYVRASELQPTDYELIVAAATALRQADRAQESEDFYRKAVVLKPLDPRGHTNLGAILHLNGKYHQAVDSYREALRLQPDDATTLTNLHKLHSVLA